MSSFLDRFPQYAWTAASSAHTDLVGSRVYACLVVTRHLRFWQNNRDLLRATAVTRGMEQTPSKSQHTKSTLEKKIVPPLLPGFELATFRSRVRRSYQQAIPAPTLVPTLIHARPQTPSFVIRLLRRRKNSGNRSFEIGGEQRYPPLLPRGGVT